MEASVAQSGRASRCQRECRGFESLHSLQLKAGANGQVVMMDTQGLLFSLAEMLTGSRLEPVTVRVAIATAVESKRNRGLRHRYILKLSSALSKFCVTFGDRELHTIKPVEIEEWLQKPEWASDTRKGYLQCARTLFSFGIKRGWCFHNAAMKVDAPMSEDAPPGILTVDECERLLVACRATDAALLPFIAVQLFGGLRSIEARTLEWASVNCETVNISAARSKTRRRRLVPILPQLKEWIELGGDLPARGWRKRLERVRIAAGIGWPRNCLRHSFVSYMMPLHGAAKVAAWAGHSEAILFNHYRALVSELECQRFLQLKPLHALP